MTTKRKIVSPPLYWDVAKIVWGYLASTPDLAIEYGLNCRYFQRIAVQRALECKFYGRAMFELFRYRQVLGCGDLCLTRTCSMCVNIPIWELLQTNNYTHHTGMIDIDHPHVIANVLHHLFC